MAYSSKFTEEVLSSGQKNKKKKSGYVESVLNGTYKSELPQVTVSYDEDDVAPIKLNNSSIKEEDKKRTWFNTGAFSDGYDFGDITKTILGTAVDIGTNVVKGVASMGEGIGKLGAGGIAQVADWIGQDEYADKVRDRLSGKDEEYNEFWNKISPSSNVNKISDKLDSSSLIGEKSDDLVSSAGNLLGSAAGQMVGIPWWVTMGTSSAGQELGNAYKNGATDGEAWTSAAISGASEVLLEKLSGGIKFGGKTLDDTLLKPLTNKITNKVANTLVKYGVDVVGEGTEEVLTEITSNIGKKLTYEDDKTWGEVLASEEALDNYLEAFLGGAVMGGVFNSGKVVNSLKTSRDYDTGLTDNEQKVVDSEVAKRTEGKNLTKKQIADIETQVKNDLEKGYISTDTIESVLGGDTYTNLKSTRDNKTKIENEIKELESKKNVDITVKEMEYLKNLREQLKEIDTNTLETDLQSKIGQMIKSDAYLQRSYQEKAKRSQKFTYDASKVTNEYENAALESASRVMNDTNRTHEFVEPVVKLAKDKGTFYEFTNNEELAKNNYQVKGKAINGLTIVEDGGKKKVLINVDSPKALNTIVGHETTHLLEGIQEYQELQDAIFNYAKTKGDFDSRQASLYSLYKDIKGADVNSELTADLVGDYLFTDNNFISELSTQKPTVFQKIKELIDDLVVRFKGTKEEKALREVQKKFKEAYRNSKNVISEDINNKYALSQGTLQEVTDVVTQTREVAEKSNVQFVKLKDNTIKPLVDYGIKDLPMLERSGHVRENILTEEQAKQLGYTTKNKHYHGLGVKKYLEIIDAMDNPIAVYQYTEKGKYDTNNFIVVTPVKMNGIDSVVPVEINQKGQYNQVEIDYNKIKSAYFETKTNYINDLLKEGKIKEIFTQSSAEQTSLSASNISQNKTGVNSDILPVKYSIQESTKDTQYSQTNNNENQTAPIGNYNVYGEDVKYQEAIAPLQEEIQVLSETVNKVLENVKPIAETLQNNVENVSFDINNAIQQKQQVKSANDILPTTMTEIKKNDTLKETTSPNIKMRKWVETSTESDVVNREILPEDLDTKKIFYEVKSNKKTLESANRQLNNLGYDDALTQFNLKIRGGTKTTVEDIVLGERLIQEAMKKGDKKTAGELLQDVAILGTELGQQVQALSIIQRMTPEGQLKMLQKVVNRQKTKGDKTFDNVEITQEMIDKILGVYAKTSNEIAQQLQAEIALLDGVNLTKTDAFWVSGDTHKYKQKLKELGFKWSKENKAWYLPDASGTYDQAELNKVVDEVKQQIADSMDVTGMEKVNSWRYLSMLGNPKTHIRNIISNVAMKGTLKVKNALARTIEDIIPIKNKTKTWKSSSNEVKKFAKQTTVEMKDIISGEGKYSETTSIKAKRDMFKNKILNNVYEFNSDLLSKEDWWFSKSAFESSFSEFLTANGIETQQDIENNPKIVEKGKNYALEQAQIATFRQYSWLANKIRDIENKNPVTQTVVGSIIPFKKTPINVAKTGLSYSPLGFAKTLTYDISQVKNGNMDASTLIDHIAQNTTGTALTLIGYMLAKSGFLNGGGEDDKEGKYDYQLGKQAYSLNINGNTYSLSWLSPVAMPLFVGANAYEQLEEGQEWNPDVVMETLAQTLDPLSEMSFLSSLDDVLSSYDSGVQKFAGIGEAMLQNYATQFIPTLSSQTAATLDDTKRSTKVAGDSGFKIFDETLNKLMYKIPFLRQTLEPTTDIWGNEVKQSDNILERAFENYLSPASAKKNIATNIDEELKDLYSETGDNGLLPIVPSNYVNYHDTKYKMSAKEYTNYKKTYGQTANELLEELFDTNTYKSAPSEEKADLVNKVYDYARDEAKKEYLLTEGVEYTNAKKDDVEYYKENNIKGAVENDMSFEEYNYYVKNPDKYRVIEQIDTFDNYDSYKEKIEEIKKQYSTEAKLTSKQKATLSKQRKAAVQQYIDSLNLDIPQKIMLEKMAGGYSIKNYERYMFEYIESLPITVEEKIAIHKQLFG